MRVEIFNSSQHCKRMTSQGFSVYQLADALKAGGFVLGDSACTMAKLQVINLIINVTHATRWGWRLSLGFAFVPSFFLFLGGVFLPDSPNSLLERGYPEQVRTLCFIAHMPFPQSLAVKIRWGIRSLLPLVYTDSEFWLVPLLESYLGDSLFADPRLLPIPP